MPRSFLSKEDTIFTAGKRFSFTNITNEDFESKWGGVPIVVPPHKTIEISDRVPFIGAGMGENLALKFTRELVDKILLGQVNEMPATTPMEEKKRSNVAAGMRVPFQRQKLEDQILKELEPEDEAGLRYLGEAKIREIEFDQSKKEGVDYDNNKDRFIDLDEIPKNSEPLPPVARSKPKSK